MARALRIQFPGAIYHAMARGNARQKIFCNERDDGRLLEGLEVVADRYRVDRASFTVKHRKRSSRDVAAWLARRVTTATLREWSSPFGLGHPDSVRNLIRRAEQAMQRSRTFRKEVDHIPRSLPKKNENRV